MHVEVLNVEIKPRIFHVESSMHVGAQILITYRDGSLGQRHALSVVNYSVDVTKGMKEYHKQMFIKRAASWL